VLSPSIFWPQTGYALRIAYILTTLGIGGAEKQVVSLAERMSAKGHTVTLIVLKHFEGEEWSVKMPVLRLNIRKTPLGIWRGLGFARNFLDIFRADIIHSHSFPANMFARLLRGMGAKTVSINTIHNVFEGGWHRMVLYRLTDSLATHLTAVSTAAMERFVRLGAIPATKITVLTNGIDTKVFSADRGRRGRVRRAMDAGQTFVWLAVGRIAAAKDYPNLLEAFEKVMTVRDAALWIAGEGETSDLPGCDGVQFLGLRRDIVELLDAADGFVLSSAWEGMPLALGEAMAMEKPVVATDVGGVRELIVDAGRIVPARDSDALAAQMLAVMAMPVAERAAFGKRARRQIEVNYSMDAKAVEWEDLYRKWLLQK